MDGERQNSTVRRFNRRDFLRLAAVGAGGAVLAACGASGAGGSNPLTAPTTPPQTSGKLTMWGWTGSFEGLESQIPTFNKKYPNIQVVVQQSGHDDVHTNFLNAIVAGSGAPDICCIDCPVLANYVDGMVDLTPLASQYKDQFVPPTYSVATVQGKFFGPPVDSEPVGSFYRLDLFDQYGVKETDIQIWDDWVAIGNKIADASGGKVMTYVQASGDSGGSLFEFMANQLGFPGYYFNGDDSKVIVDDPKMLQAVAKLQLLWSGKGVVKNPVGSYFSDENDALVKASKVITELNGPAWLPMSMVPSLTDQSGKWRLMRLPAMQAGGPRIGYAQPSSLVISKQTKMLDVAWELVRMSAMGDGARVQYKFGELPAWKPVMDEVIQEPNPFFGGQKINELYDEIAKDTPPVFYGKGYNEAGTIMGKHLQDILSGNVKPEQGLADAAKEMREKLKKG